MVAHASRRSRVSARVRSSSGGKYSRLKATVAQVAKLSTLGTPASLTRLASAMKKPGQLK